MMYKRCFNLCEWKLTKKEKILRKWLIFTVTIGKFVSNIFKVVCSFSYDCLILSGWQIAPASLLRSHVFNLRTVENEAPPAPPPARSLLCKYSTANKQVMDFYNKLSLLGEGGPLVNALSNKELN